LHRVQEVLLPTCVGNYLCNKLLEFLPFGGRYAVLFAELIDPAWFWYFGLRPINTGPPPFF